MFLQCWKNPDRLSHFLFGEAQFVQILQIQPKLRTRSEEMTQA